MNHSNNDNQYTIPDTFIEHKIVRPRKPCNFCGGTDLTWVYALRKHNDRKESYNIGVWCNPCEKFREDI